MNLFENLQLMKENNADTQNTHKTLDEIAEEVENPFYSNFKANFGIVNDETKDNEDDTDDKTKEDDEDAYKTITGDFHEYRGYKYRYRKSFDYWSGDGEWVEEYDIYDKDGKCFTSCGVHKDPKKTIDIFADADEKPNEWTEIYKNRWRIDKGLGEITRGIGCYHLSINNRFVGRYDTVEQAQNAYYAMKYKKKI